MGELPVKFLPRAIRNTLEGRFLSLLVAIILYLAIAPVLDGTIQFRFLLDIFFSVILLAGIYAVSKTKRDTVIAFTLAVPTLLTLWLREITEPIAIDIASDVLSTIFFAYTVVVLLAYILNSAKVNRHVIYAALIAYLLMGLMWTSIYSLVDTVSPGSFDVLLNWSDNPRLVYLYFSFVTLTTLGYGDITPLTAQAYSFSILEAIIGQIYITVLIARLVGMQVSHSEKNRPSGSDR